MWIVLMVMIFVIGLIDLYYSFSGIYFKLIMYLIMEMLCLTIFILENKK